MSKVLMINHPAKECGVYQYFKRAFQVINKSKMFRHLDSIYDKINVTDNSLKNIIENNIFLDKFREEWRPNNFIKNYERILDNILMKGRK